MMEKNQLRQQLRSKRRSLSGDDAIYASKVISERLIAYVNWPTITSVHIYRALSSENEVTTDIVIEYIRTSWPTIHLEVASQHAQTPFPSESFDVIIVPLVGFDVNNNRLGLGSGWYDQFLAMQSSAKSIGLAYELQHVEALPVQPHDKPLRCIITESAIYEIGIPPVTAITSAVT